MIAARLRPYDIQAMKRVRLLTFNSHLSVLDYKVPEGMVLEPGMVVIAPLGPRQITGIVEFRARPEHPVGKIGKWATSESGDTLEMIERPHGGISFVLVDGQRSAPVGVGSLAWFLVSQRRAALRFQSTS